MTFEEDFEILPAIHAAVVPARSGHTVLVAGVNDPADLFHAHLAVEVEDGLQEPARRSRHRHDAQKDIPTSSCDTQHLRQGVVGPLEDVLSGLPKQTTPSNLRSGKRERSVISRGTRATMRSSQPASSTFSRLSFSCRPAHKPCEAWLSMA